MKKEEINEYEEEQKSSLKGATSLSIKGDAEIRALVELYYDLQEGRIGG